MGGWEIPKCACALHVHISCSVTHAHCNGQILFFIILDGCARYTSPSSPSLWRLRLSIVTTHLLVGIQNGRPEYVLWETNVSQKWNSFSLNTQPSKLPRARRDSRDSRLRRSSMRGGIATLMISHLQFQQTNYLL